MGKAPKRIVAVLGLSIVVVFASACIPVSNDWVFIPTHGRSENLGLSAATYTIAVDPEQGPVLLWINVPCWASGNNASSAATSLTQGFPQGEQKDTCVGGTPQGWVIGGVVNNGDTFEIISEDVGGQVPPGTFYAQAEVRTVDGTAVLQKF